MMQIGKVTSEETKLKLYSKKEKLVEELKIMGTCCVCCIAVGQKVPVQIRLFAIDFRRELECCISRTFGRLDVSRRVVDSFLSGYTISLSTSR